VLCSKPFIKNDLELQTAFPCGKCDECLANKARIWKHRILLEADSHTINSFITLTFNEDYVPNDGCVNKEELQRYLKRLRYYLDVEKRKLRYFGVGEYGDNTWRPHYHMCLFGVGDVSSIIKAWSPRGNVDIGSVEDKSAGYITGYVTKGMTNKKEEALKKKRSKPRIHDVFKDASGWKKRIWWTRI